MATRDYLCLAISLLLLTLVQYTIQSKTNASLFSFLKNLEGCKKGQNVDDLHHLKGYLAKFRYLGNHLKSKNEVTTTMTTKENDDYFDKNLEKAIKTYQLKYKLNVTGYLDTATVKHMMKPRSVSPDIINGTSSIRKNDKTSMFKNRKLSYGRSLYAVNNNKWPPSKYNLTYKIELTTVVVDNMDSAVANALRTWSLHSPFTFHVVVDQKPERAFDLVFGFYTGDHGDGTQFDGPGGIVSHSFYPPDGRSHYDATENWSDDPGPNEYDLESVILHESGHLLGLGDSQDPNAVMHHRMHPGAKRRELQEDDIKAIQALYGST